jgi:hypothetical protein
MTIKPDPQDFAVIEQQYGPLPAHASVKQQAYRYRLAQAEKLIRETQTALEVEDAIAALKRAEH